MKIRGLLDTDNLFAFGGDGSSGSDEERVNIPPERKPRQRSRQDDDEYEDTEEDEHITNAKDRKIAKLSRECNKRRIENRDLKDQLAEKDEDITTLRGELVKAEKLQKAFDKLKGDNEAQQEIVRRFAIRSAIEKDSTKNEKGEAAPRAWYDVDMVESLLDRKTLSVDTNDFSVGGLTDQLDAIAKEKPFLVKSSESSNEKDSQDRNRQQQQPSGQAPQSSATGNREQQNSQNEAQMLADFPALQNVI